MTQSEQSKEIPLAFGVYIVATGRPTNGDFASFGFVIAKGDTGTLYHAITVPTSIDIGISNDGAKLVITRNSSATDSVRIAILQMA